MPNRKTSSLRHLLGLLFLLALPALAQPVTLETILQKKPFQSFTQGRFKLYFYAGSEADRERQRVLADRERALTKIEAFFGRRLIDPIHLLEIYKLETNPKLFSGSPTTPIDTLSSEGGVLEMVAKISRLLQSFFKADSRKRAVPQKRRAGAQASPLSAVNRRQLAQLGANGAWDRLNHSFSRLPENDKIALGGKIGARLREFGTGLNELQAVELKWLTQASVSAEWAAEKAAAGGADLHLARNLGDLYYSGKQYLQNRKEFLQFGGEVGQ